MARPMPSLPDAADAAGVPPLTSTLDAFGDVA
jgi:hypothetical protein